MHAYAWMYAHLFSRSLFSLYSNRRKIIEMNKYTYSIMLMHTHVCPAWVLGFTFCTNSNESKWMCAWWHGFHHNISICIRPTLLKNVLEEKKATVGRSESHQIFNRIKIFEYMSIESQRFTAPHFLIKQIKHTNLPCRVLIVVHRCALLFVHTHFSINKMWIWDNERISAAAWRQIFWMMVMAMMTPQKFRAHLMANGIKQS